MKKPIMKMRYVKSGLLHVMRALAFVNVFKKKICGASLCKSETVLSNSYVEVDGSVKQPDFVGGKVNFDWVFRIEKGQFIWTKVYLSQTCCLKEP